VIRGLLIVAAPLYLYLLLGVSRLGFEVGLRHHEPVVAQLPQTTSFAADPSIPGLRRIDNAALLAAATQDATPRPSPSASAVSQPATAARAPSVAAPAPTPTATKKASGSGGQGGATAKPTPTPHGHAGR
jgi:hypothetical protein